MFVLINFKFECAIVKYKYTVLIFVFICTLSSDKFFKTKALVIFMQVIYGRCDLRGKL
jgi:hypothetical protein